MIVDNTDDGIWIAMSHFHDYLLEARQEVHY